HSISKRFIFIVFKLRTMKRSVIGILSAVLILSACGDSSTEKKTAEQKEQASYEKTKETLEEKEKKSPQNFITVSTHDKRNLIGQTVIKGTVSSKATVAVYKDIELKIYFYSKTGALLEEDKET